MPHRAATILQFNIRCPLSIEVPERIFTNSSIKWWSVSSAYIIRSLFSSFQAAFCGWNSAMNRLLRNVANTRYIIQVWLNIWTIKTWIIEWMPRTFQNPRRYRLSLSYLMGRWDILSVFIFIRNTWFQCSMETGYPNAELWLVGFRLRWQQIRNRRHSCIPVYD